MPKRNGAIFYELMKTKGAESQTTNPQSLMLAQSLWYVMISQSTVSNQLIVDQSEYTKILQEVMLAFGEEESKLAALDLNPIKKKKSPKTCMVTLNRAISETKCVTLICNVVFSTMIMNLRKIFSWFWNVI